MIRCPGSDSNKRVLVAVLTAGAKNVIVKPFEAEKVLNSLKQL